MLVDALLVSRHWWTVVFTFGAVAAFVGLLLATMVAKRNHYDMGSVAGFVLAQCVWYGVFSGLRSLLRRRGSATRLPSQAVQLQMGNNDLFRSGEDTGLVNDDDMVATGRDAEGGRDKGSDGAEGGQWSATES